MKQVSITRICDIQVGKTPSRSNTSYWGSGSLWLSIADMNQGSVIERTKEAITEKAIKECNCKIIPRNTVLFSFKLSIGKVGITNCPMYTNEAIAAFIIKDHSKLDTKFLFYVLKSVDHSIGSNKAVMGKTLNKEQLKKIEIPLPPLEDQKRIGKILDEANTLRNKRKQASNLLDDYLKSVFWKMFGDLINDSSTYQQIGETTDFIDYRGKTPEKSTSGVPLITAKHVKKGFFSFDPEEYIAEEKYNEIMTRGFPRPNDVLFTTEGATLGNVCRIPRHIDRFAVGQRLITLQCKDCLTPEYLQFILLNGKIRLEIFKQATGSAAQGIRSAMFYKIRIPIPPKELQNKFAIIVRQYESIKQNMLTQSEELENQFQALMQNAFKANL